MEQHMNKGYDLFLFAGQSNMAGRGITSERFPGKAPAVLKGAGAEFRAVSDPGRLYPIAEPFGAAENNLEGIYEPGMKTGSLVSSFVNAYYEKTKVPILGISASKGGSSILEWLPGTAYFADLSGRLDACLKYVAEQGICIRHQYILWCQGETDGDHEMSGEEYIEHFETFWTGVKGLGVEQCFLIQIGHFNPYCVKPDAPLHDYSEIMAAQKSIAEKIPDVHMVSTSFQTMLRRGLMKDAFHYYQAAYNEVGREAGENTAACCMASNLESLPS